MLDFQQNLTTMGKNMLMFDKISYENQEFVLIVEQDVNVIVGKITATNNFNQALCIDGKNLRREISLINVTCNLLSS